MFLCKHESTHQKKQTAHWRVRNKKGRGLPGAPWGLGYPGLHHEWVGFSKISMGTASLGQQVRWRELDLALSLIPYSSVGDIQCDPSPLRRGLSPITVSRLALHAMVLLNFPLPPVSEHHPDDHS